MCARLDEAMSIARLSSECRVYAYHRTQLPFGHHRVGSALIHLDDTPCDFSSVFPSCHFETSPSILDDLLGCLLCCSVVLVLSLVLVVVADLVAALLHALHALLRPSLDASGGLPCVAFQWLPVLLFAVLPAAAAWLLCAFDAYCGAAYSPFLLRCCGCGCNWVPVNELGDVRREALPGAQAFCALLTAPRTVVAVVTGDGATYP